MTELKSQTVPLVPVAEWVASAMADAPEPSEQQLRQIARSLPVTSENVSKRASA